MSETIGAMIGLALFLFLMAWVTVFPVIGILWICGVLK